MYPYGLMADIHLHNWNAFAKPTKDGVNNRLYNLLGEIERCAKEVRAAGGDTIYIAGDVFHTRGVLTPQVLNLTLACFKGIVSNKVRVCVMPGNHDLEGKDSFELSSSVAALKEVGVEVCHDPTVFTPSEKVIMIPWVESVTELKKMLAGLSEGSLKGRLHHFDCMIHAPVDGVITGLPSHGLNPNWLKDLGFKRVFAGHYHNHASFENKVVSIGALAHHTWSDVGTKAGFLIVHQEYFVWRKSLLPEFIDISQDTPWSEIELMADGNYIRCKTESSDIKEIDKLRNSLLKLGAAGVSVVSVPKPVERRKVEIGSTLLTGLETSVAKFIESEDFADKAKLIKEALTVLAEVNEK
jgi:DNA repair exonuclease SbcCD nuclease subunit